MSYKIAVASSDGKVVNKHFGHARQFIVYEVDDAGKWSFIEMRSTNPICNMGEHNESSMQQTVKLLSDCKVVVVSQIGFIAEQALMDEGISSYSVSDFINSVLPKVIRAVNERGRKYIVKKH